MTESAVRKGELPVKESAERPARPSLENPNPAPVLIKQPPPFTVRIAQVLWALSFVVGTLAIVLLFVGREDYLPLIVGAIQDVDQTRAEATYDSAANTVFWSTFGILVTVLLVQITLLVSFMNRRRGARWWQFATVVAQLVVITLMTQLVARGEDGLSLRQMTSGQVGLALLALLMSVFPGAIAWTARQHDVRRGHIVSVTGT